MLRSPRRIDRPLTLALALSVAACDASPIAWQPATSRVAVGADTAAAFAFDSTLALVPAPAPAVIAPTDYEARGCAGSLRLGTARDRLGRTLVAGAWWAIRADSGANLLAAVSADGGRTWTVTAPVDTTDAGHRGCARPAPAVAIEPRTRYVHVAYFLDAREGPGVFFAHSMDEGRMFHAPVPVVYGERPAHVAIAAAGDTVIVAYEDPNTAQRAIGLAISVTQGHLFEKKAVSASPSSGPAEVPRVGVKGGRVAVGWLERGAAPGASALVVRQGRVKAGAITPGNVRPGT